MSEDNNINRKEHLKRLKIERGRALASLTLKRRKIDRLMNDFANVFSVRVEVTKLRDLFSNFSQAHDTYHVQLEDNGKEKDASAAYFQGVQETVTIFCSEVETWLNEIQNDIDRSGPGIKEWLNEIPNCDVQSSVAESNISQVSLRMKSTRNRTASEVKPEDSVSQVSASRMSTRSRTSRSSNSSLMSEARRQEIARLAELRVNVDSLKAKQQLEQEELELKYRKERLNLETEVARTKARERAYADMDQESRKSSLVHKKYYSKPAQSSVEIKSTWPEYGQGNKTSFLYGTSYRDPVQPPVKLKPELPVYRPTTSFLQPSSEPVDNERTCRILEQQNKIMQGIVRQQNRANLPERQMPIFGGDPLEYRTFIRAFETLIESKEPDPSSSLYYLEQYTTGRVKELVRSCQHMRPNEGYAQARYLLEQRFGDNHKIAMAYVEKVLDGPPIKADDGNALESFSITLSSCKNSLEAIGYLKKIENPECMRKIVERLPYNLQGKWRDTADFIMNVDKRDVYIDDIARFVEKNARALNNPIFGKAPQDPKQRRDSKLRSSFLTGIEKDTINNETFSNDNDKSKKCTCMICHEEHQITSCPQLKIMSLSDRWDMVMEKKLCFGCLKKGHQSRDCFKKKPCSECNKKHATLLHPPGSIASERTKLTKDAATQATSLRCRTNSIPNQKTKMVLPVVPVKVRLTNSDEYVETYALLDSGSTSTFCTDSLLQRLQARGKKSRIKLTTLGSTNEIDTVIVDNLNVSDIDDNKSIHLPAVLSRPNIPVSKEEIPTQEDVDRWPQLQERLHLEKLDSGVDLLIGVDVPEALRPKETIRTDGGPYATKVELGWVINGPVERRQIARCTGAFLSKAHPDTVCQACSDLKDAYGDSRGPSEEDRKFLENAEKTIKQCDDKHYEVSLPIKDQSICLPNNRIQAERRAAQLKKRLLNNPKFKEDYTTFMKDMVVKEHARKVPEDQKNKTERCVWYIPHHGIYHKKKPDKIRVVFDCSARFRGVSLNDVLFQGPDLTNSLIGVLVRFRQEPIAAMADIEGMFHQVGVPESDRNFLRFLWWTDGKLDQEPEEYEMTVHLFGAVSSPSIANFVLKKNADNNRTRFDEEVISIVHKNFYVDDCLKSWPSVEVAINFIHHLCNLMKDGGFRLTKWVSNSRQVLQSIPESERAKEVKDFDFAHDNLPIERALGVTWNVESDTLEFKVSLKDRPFTRRGLLSVVSSVYDPLGMVAPFVLTAKILLQDLTRRKLEWDQEISQEDRARWQIWIGELMELAKFSSSRCFKPPNYGKIASSQIHNFSDASNSAYGTVSYLRMVNAQNQVHCSFVFGKSRLAPLKQLTIPKLELAAAALSVQSDKLLRNELDQLLAESVFWTDSMTVIHYIEDESKKFHTYVGNRVSYIRDASRSEQWKYVDTDSNPADDVSRGLPVHSFLSHERWLSGPEFLWQSESEWPQRPTSHSDPLANDPEVKKIKSNLVTFRALNDGRQLDAIFERFSSWMSLKRFIARCIRCQRNFHARAAIRNKNCSYCPTLKASDPFTVNEILESEKEILCYVQRKAFPEELLALESGSNVKRSSHLLKLDPFLVDGLIRVGGRLRRSFLPDEAKHQVIIPKNSHISELIIFHLHVKSGHSGREHVLSLLRQRFWVVRGNSTVRGVLSSCYDCRRRQSPAGQQKMGDLPEARITPEKPPFTFTGVDYFGPFFVRVKRSTVKRYGVIFTCLAIRAVHIEVSHTLDSNSFILALRRFIARRGQVKVMYSDNGTNFVGGIRELREAILGWNQAQVHDYLLQNEIEWHFNPPSASHFGGAWERCIRTVRKILNALTKEQILNEESLATLMTEVEAIINSRPLTKVSSDCNDDEPLTPNHLLLLKRDPTLPPGLFDRDDNYTRKRWRQVQYMVNLFWRRWTKEYIPSLQERHKWKYPTRNFATNDVVLIVNDCLPRNTWLIGRIIDVFPDERGFVRRARVKTKTGTFDRPITKLCLLEQTT